MVYPRIFNRQRKWQPKQGGVEKNKTITTTGVTNKKKSNNVSSKPRTNVCVSTWNVDGKGSPEEIEKLLKSDTLSCCPDIVCLQEANLPSAGEDTTHFKWMCSGVYGSAVLVNKSAPIKCTAFHRICDQICVAELSGYDINFKVISCYIPPSSDYLSEDMWSKLKEILKSYPSNQTFIVGGDFNAELGKNDLTPVTVGTIGPALHHKESNDHGIKLKQLAVTGHYRIVSTYNNKGLNIKDYFTYKDGDNKGQRDYIIMPYSSQSFINDGLFNNWHKGYNHAILTTKLLLKEPMPLKDSLMVNSWNVHGASPTKVDSILTEQNLSVVCVQGLFLTSEDDVQSDNFNWYCSKKLWTKNVGIVVKKSEDISVANHEVVSEFLCSVDITVKNETLKLISCYLPIHTDPNHEVVAKQLTDLVKSIDKDKQFILAGDFSTHPSEDYKDEKGGKIDEPMQDNQNTTFMNKLAEEAKLCWKTSLWFFWKKNNSYFVSHKSESLRSSPHHFFMPQEWRKKITFLKMEVTWIPNFENGIVSLNLNKNATESQPDVHTTKTITTVMRNVTEETSDVSNGVIRKTKTYDLLEWDPDEEDILLTSTIEKSGEIPDQMEPSVEDNNISTHEGDTNNLLADDKTGITKAEESYNLSDEDLQKFKDKMPLVVDLRRIFSGFTLFYKTSQWSYAFITNPTNLLVSSFKENNCGKITIEEVTTLEEDTLHKKDVTCSIKWNGILLERAKVATKKTGFPNAKREAVQKFLNKLISFCYTVKGKRSFYNKGAPPLLMGDPKLNGFFKLVDKETLPTVDDVIKHIDEFFIDDNYSDLAFGPAFSEDEQIDIKKHARSKGLGYRYFSEKKDDETKNYIAVFKKFSPRVIKERLMKKKEDPKFVLVPPAGKLVNSFATYILGYETEQFKEEARQVSIASQVKPQTQISIGKKQVLNKKKETNNRTIQQRNIRRPTVQPWLTSTTNASSARNGRNQERMQTNREAYGARNVFSQERMQNNRGGMKRPYADQSSSRYMDNQYLDRGMKRPFEDQSRSSYIDDLYLDREGHYSPVALRGNQTQRDSFLIEDSRMPDIGRSFDMADQWRSSTQASDSRMSNVGRSFVMADPWLSPTQASDSRMSNVGRSFVEADQWRSPSQALDSRISNVGRSFDMADNWRSSTQASDSRMTNVGRSSDVADHWRPSTQASDSRMPYVERSFDMADQWGSSTQSSEPYQKRARFDRPVKDEKSKTYVIKISKPAWNRDLAPLVMVWPITVNSHTEERPHIILEENFSVDYVRAQGNTLAVVVSLPLLNGTEKKFCLSIAASQQDAAEMAFYEIVKHSTIIKPNPTYLCEGITPNFVRYRIPCQANPRTYIIVGRQDTGTLNEKSLKEIFEIFIASFNEDLFFDKNDYTYTEKMLLIEEAPNYNLKARHFGDVSGIANHYVCVYKKKPKMQILEEVMNTRNNHPKYLITTNKLPPKWNYGNKY